MNNVSKSVKAKRIAHNNVVVKTFYLFEKSMNRTSPRTYGL